MTGERLQKVLARAGVASRRAAERLILAGRIDVNGATVRELGTRVLPSDRVAVDGRALDAGDGSADRLYLALNKPVGVVSTASDPWGRATVVELADAPARVYPVGRLDADSEGLLLLTNDGELANRVIRPRYGVDKEYHVLVLGVPNRTAIEALRNGVALEDGVTAPALVDRLERDGDRTWLRIVLHEGRKRQIRRMLEAIGHRVERLVRVRVGPIRLGRLPPGATRPLTREEVEKLRVAVGL